MTKPNNCIITLVTCFLFWQYILVKSSVTFDFHFVSVVVVVVVVIIKEYMNFWPQELIASIVISFSSLTRQPPLLCTVNFSLVLHLFFFLNILGIILYTLPVQLLLELITDKFVIFIIFQKKLDNLIWCRVLALLQKLLIWISTWQI